MTGSPGSQERSASRPPRTSTLVNRNVTIHGRRTSLRLEPAMWDALAEMARRERLTIHELCTAIQSRRQESTLTAAIRVHILVYFREAATEQGHELAGHGRLTDSPGRAAGHGGPGCEVRGSGL